MSSLSLSRFAVSAAASAALLAGCGWSQPPLAAPNSLTRSWVAPEATSEALLYAATRQTVEIFSYPSGQQVGELDIRHPNGLCSDPNGDVFVVADGSVLEYAHGGTTPIATVKSKFGFPLQCAFDPTTGNLALIDTYFTGPENIAVYKKVTGKGHVYYDSGPIYDFFDCAYDAGGNLFATGYSQVLAELPEGGDKFFNYKPSLKTADSELAGIQWDGKYVTAQELPPDGDRALLDRIIIVKKKALVVSRTRLAGSRIAFKWLYAGVATGLDGQYHHKIGFWRYPRGGDAIGMVGGNGIKFFAATISVAP